MQKNKNFRSKRKESASSIPEKATIVLNLILIALIVIVFRIWHLGVIQHEKKLEESQKPQKRTVVEVAKRATIRDRFNIPLAINEISYRATILYSQIRQIPSIRFEIDETGKKVKKYKRKEYITAISELLGKELDLNPERLEDLIHAKGSFYGQVPFVIKEDISEKEYYRLKMLEKDWLGIQVQKIPKRHYPKGRVASDIIGYMGAINRQEYDKIMHQIKVLEDFIQGSDSDEENPFPEGVTTLSEAKQKLQDLLDHAYTINDYVGKTGIEASFENILRGYHGKKSYYSDSRGNFLKEIPGAKKPNSGQRVLLTISSELQEYAELLLTQNERIRETKLSKYLQKKTKQPWIKGGAIIAIEPNSGEIVAMASYPRIDPNDFIPSGNPEIAKKKIAGILRWFESEAYIAEMWDQKRPLERERFNEDSKTYYDEALTINWDNYLNIILKENSPLFTTIKNVSNIKTAWMIQKSFKELLKTAETDNAYWLVRVLYGDDNSQNKNCKIPNDKLKEIETLVLKHEKIVSHHKKILEPFFSKLELHYEKVLLVDLCKLGVGLNCFNDSLIQEVGNQTLTEYKNACCAFKQVHDAVKKMTKELYHEQDFLKWRKENEKEFLKEKRTYEKNNNLYPKPYLDYFDKQENAMFEEFFKKYEWNFLDALLSINSLDTHPEIEAYVDYFKLWHKELNEGAHSSLPWKDSYDELIKVISTIIPHLRKPYLTSFRSYSDLNEQLYGRYRKLKAIDNKYLEKSLAAAFYPMHGYGYGRSQAFRQAATQGSIFKLVTSYAALKQRYQSFTTEKITPENLNPLVITDQIFKRGKEKCVGYHQDGRPIPVHYNGGRMLKSHTRSLGKIDLLRALENSSNPYFSLLAAEHLKSPTDLADVSKELSFGKPTGISLPGEIGGKVPEDLEYNKTGLYAMANGQHTLIVTPLQTAVMLSALVNGGEVLKPNIVKLIAGKKPIIEKSKWDELNNSQFIYPIAKRVKRQIFLPALIRNMLLTGMRKVVLKQLADGLPSLSRFYKEYPGAIADYLDLKNVIVGKTSTSESMEHIDLDPVEGTNLYTHVWFGGIAFDKDIPENVNSLLYRDNWGNPELVVVIYLKYGSWGKESAPLGAQMIKKWREIKEKYNYSSTTNP